MNLQVTVDGPALMKATGYDTRLCGLVLALLEASGAPEIEMGEHVLGTSGEHIRGFRQEFRKALGLVEPDTT